MKKKGKKELKNKLGKKTQSKKKPLPKEKKIPSQKKEKEKKLVEREKKIIKTDKVNKLRQEKKHQLVTQKEKESKQIKSSKKIVQKPKSTSQKKSVQKPSSQKQKQIKQKQIKKEKKIKLSKKSILNFIKIGGIATIIFIILWTFSNITKRKIILDDLKNFQVPSNPENFNPKSNGYIIDLIRNGKSLIPYILKNYEKLNYNQKIAIVISLGEIKDKRAISLLVKVLKKGEKNLPKYALISLGKFKEKSIEYLISELNKFPKDRKIYLIEAIARTETLKGLEKILDIINKEKESLEIRKKAIECLVFFGKKDYKKSIPFYLVKVIKEKEIGKVALNILKIFQTKNYINIDRDINLIKEKLIRLYNNYKDEDIRKRVVLAMGIIGTCLSQKGGNYSSYFIEYVKESYYKGKGSEKAAAAYVLGQFNYNKILPELINNLKSNNPELVKYSALGLIKLNNVEVPSKILNMEFPKKDYVIKSLGKILREYYLYVIKLDLGNKAINYILDLMEYSSYNLFKYLSNILGIYLNQPIKYFILWEDDIKDIKKFKEKLNKDKKAPYVYIKNKILEKVPNLLELKEKELKEKIKDIVDILNHIIIDNNFYTSNRFKNIKLSKSLQNWIKQNDENRYIHINRLILQELFPQSIEKTPFFGVVDIKNPRSFILKIRPPLNEKSDKTKKNKKVNKKAKRTPLSRHIWFEFTSEDQKLLENYNIQDKKVPYNINIIIIDTLNKIIQDTLYDEYLFKKIKLPKKIVKLLKQNPKGRKLFKLNRILLEIAYPNEIKSIYSISEAKNINKKNKNSKKEKK